MRDVAVYIVRHGETDWNVQGIVQGQIDTELNDEGRRQAEYVGEYLKVIPFTHAYTSDLRRASDVSHCAAIFYQPSYCKLYPRRQLEPL